MARIDAEIIINRPVKVGFDFVADERNEPRYNSGMLRAEKLSSGPRRRLGRAPPPSRLVPSDATVIPLVIPPRTTA